MLLSLFPLLSPHEALMFPVLKKPRSVPVLLQLLPSQAWPPLLAFLPHLPPSPWSCQFWLQWSPMAIFRARARCPLEDLLWGCPSASSEDSHSHSSLSDLWVPEDFKVWPGSALLPLLSSEICFLPSLLASFLQAYLLHGCLLCTKRGK